MRQLDRNPSCDHHIAFHVQQRVDTHVNGHQRGRTGRLHCNRRSGQVQQVGKARRQEVLVISGMAKQKKTDFVDKIGIAEQVERHVGLHPRSCIDTNPALEILGHVAGVLQRLPTGFQKMTVLRVEDLRVARGEAPKTSIKSVHTRQNLSGLDVIGVGKHAARHTCCQKVSVTEPRGRVATLGKHTPKLRHGSRTRKTPRAPDDRYLVIRPCLVRHTISHHSSLNDITACPFGPDARRPVPNLDWLRLACRPAGLTSVRTRTEQSRNGTHP